jgi:hypothetical protein
METSTQARYAHRLKTGLGPLALDVTDSICLRCFRTIASTHDIAERESLEAAHECSGLDLHNTLHPDITKRPAAH